MSDDRVLLEDDDLDGFETCEPSAFFAAIRAADMWRDNGIPDNLEKTIPKKTGDTTRLVDLLSSRLAQSGAAVTVTREECELLIDLLSRHQLRLKPGGRSVPIYREASWAELKLGIAAEYVPYHQRKGLKFDDAVDRVVDEMDIGHTSKRNNKRKKAKRNTNKGKTTSKPKTMNVTANKLRAYMRGRLHPDRPRPAAKATTKTSMKPES